MEEGLKMARRVFFSFEYGDVSRAMVVRNSWVTQGREAAGFIDAADFEDLESEGATAIKDWIDEQLEGTTVTVVLVGEKTCDSRWVKYEIEKSIERSNGLLGIDISKIRDLNGNQIGTVAINRDSSEHKKYEKLIEYLGNHWHNKEETKKRGELFKQYGYNTLFIWESDFFGNQKEIINQILQFHNLSSLSCTKQLSIDDVKIGGASKFAHLR